MLLLIYFSKYYLLLNWTILYNFLTYLKLKVLLSIFEFSYIHNKKYLIFALYQLKALQYSTKNIFPLQILRPFFLHDGS